MEKYEGLQAHELFAKGKQILDSGRYEEAIQIFTELIQISESNLENKEAEITYETSLNNRGKAKCDLALKKRDKELFKDGLMDYERSVKVSGEETISPNLVAQLNLNYGREQLENWDRPQTGGFKAI